ncbi:ABC transporter permease subunit [Candidatus Latescibacterota bacterium]
MKKTLPIFRRELAAYFFSPMAYIVIAVFLMLTGWFFSGDLFLVDDSSLRSLFGMVPFIFLFFVPAITMRLISEEKKSGTIELLVTMPVTDTEIILGKFFAALGLLVVAVLFTLPYGLTVIALGEPDLGMMISGYVGVVLLGGAYVSIGVFASTISRNQVVSFIIAFMIIFVLWMLDKVLLFMPTYLVSLLQFLSIEYHFLNITRGVIDSRDVLYYVSVIVFLLVLSRLSLESRKWT